jgi:hypothetical protein
MKGAEAAASVEAPPPAFSGASNEGANAPRKAQKRPFPLLYLLKCSRI